MPHDLVGAAFTIWQVMMADDLQSVLRAMRAIPKEVKRAIQPALEKGADELVARMQYLAPEDEGDLKRAVKKERINSLGIRVEVDSENAQYQEYGVLHRPGDTRQKNQQPFFWPSVNTLKKRVRGRVDRAIGKAVKDAWNGK